MEVAIYSTIATSPGQVTVICNEDQTVDSLVSAFCTERGIRHQKEYVLRNIKHELLLNTKKIRSSGILNGDILYLGVRAQSERWLGGCNQWWLLAGVSLLISATGLVAISILQVNGSIQPLEYGVVVDAGSSHSQVFVYNWEADKCNDTAVAKQIFSRKGNGSGIDKYRNPAEAGASLVDILKAAENAVPKSDHSDTSVFLGATAGMRLLNASNQSQSDAIMESVKATLKQSPFKFSEKQSLILPGMSEGSYGWITVNYLLDNFGSMDVMSYVHSITIGTQTTQVIGALDLGGASTQMSFYPEKPEELPEQSRSPLLLYGNKYDIYAHSYLCYGVDEVIRRYKAQLIKAQLIKQANYSEHLSDPCRQVGYSYHEHYNDIFEAPCTANVSTGIPYNISKNMTFTFNGTSDSAACGVVIKKLFDFSAPCETPPCSFNGVHQPVVRGNFIAFSAFYYTTSALNLNGSFELTDFRQAYAAFCASHWTNITQNEYSTNTCLASHYIDTLLIYGYKFDNNTWRQIKFQQDVEGTDVGWTLGFMLNASNRIPAEYPKKSITVPTFVILVLLFACFVALAVGFALHAMTLKKNMMTPRYKVSTYGSV